MSSRRGGKRCLPAWGKRRDPGSLRLPPPRRPPPAPAETLRHRQSPPPQPGPVTRCRGAPVLSPFLCRLPGSPAERPDGPAPRYEIPDPVAERHSWVGRGLTGRQGDPCEAPSPSQATVKSPVTSAVTRANLSLCANKDCVWFCISFPRTPDTPHRSMGSHRAPVISLSSFQQQTPAGECSELPGQGSALRALGTLEGSLGCPGTDEADRSPGCPQAFAIKHSFIYQIKKICSSVSAKLPLVLSTFFPGKLEHRGLLFFK